MTNQNVSGNMYNCVRIGNDYNTHNLNMPKKRKHFFFVVSDLYVFVCFLVKLPLSFFAIFQ